MKPIKRERGQSLVELGISMLILVAIIGAIFLARRPEEDERAN